MRKLGTILTLCLLLLASIAPETASAQTYRFSLSTYEVETYLEADGSLTIYYYMVFENDPNADPIDYIDVGLPVSSYDYKNVEASVNDLPISKIGSSAYVNGAELALGNLAIQPGESGTVIVWARNITGTLFPYDSGDRDNYVNFQFVPSFFGSEFDKSRNTQYRMTIILPPAVSNTDGVYFTPSGWPGSEAPEASLTTDGRVYYSWYTENADVHSNYLFGAGFPAAAVPAESISSKDVFDDTASGTTGGNGGWFAEWGSTTGCCVGFAGIFIALFVTMTLRRQKVNDSRKLKYMSPKISIEGKGIKRGLTAVEAGILMEEALDKVFTMILFGLLKKEAVTVLQRDPLKLQATEPLPEGLNTYEQEFLAAFKKEKDSDRQKALQTMMVNLVATVTEKMKSFSKKETVAYYESIVKRAWTSVEAADTPEVKSAQYEHTLEWTMLDKDFNDRTTRTFTGGPVFIPIWWGRFNPGYTPAPSTVSGPSMSIPGAGGSRPSFSLPNIPGSDFAASVVNGSSAMAAGVIGNVAGFTSGVTSRTNPIPVSSASSGSGGFRGGGGGSACACACACAGCACACAGGGR